MILKNEEEIWRSSLFISFLFFSSFHICNQNDENLKLLNKNEKKSNLHFDCHCRKRKREKKGGRSYFYRHS